MKKDQKIELGCEAEDTVSGYKGICIARTEWLNGCVRVTIQPKIGTDGKLPDSATFDEPQMTRIGGGVQKGPSDTGGPIPSPQRTPNFR